MKKIIYLVCLYGYLIKFLLFFVRYIQNHCDIAHSCTCQIISPASNLIALPFSYTLTLFKLEYFCGGCSLRQPHEKQVRGLCKHMLHLKQQNLITDESTEYTCSACTLLHFTASIGMDFQVMLALWIELAFFYFFPN